jgi:hypothetical protein
MGRCCRDYRSGGIRAEPGSPDVVVHDTTERVIVSERGSMFPAGTSTMMRGRPSRPRAPGGAYPTRCAEVSQ